MSLVIMLISAAVVVSILTTFYILSLRTIVPANEVHIVQRTKDTVSYGRDGTDKIGNTYYNFPSWIPKLGVVVTKLSTTVIDIDIPNYPAYDKDRLPFVVDIKAFFRIEDFNKAATRVQSIKELKEQLEAIVKGAARSILAKENLELIMSERNKYGDMFTELVSSQLKEWGVTVVKNIELMDIRDGEGSKVIYNIMQKKESAIEMEKRVEVAKNLKTASEAEILSKKEIELAQQKAEREVGLNQAEVNKEVGVANQKQEQEVQAAAKVTAEKEMEVKRVREVQAAEIEKQAETVKAQKDKAVIEVQADASIIQTEAQKKVAILNAEANKQKQVLDAEANKEQTILQATAEKEQIELRAAATKTQIELKADADLKAATNEAKGIKMKGESTADARERLEKAQVAGQIELSEKIGENKEYQDFVVRQKQVEAMQAIGIEQAKNLSGAQIKIFATGSDVQEGATNAAKVLAPKTGLDLASTLEGLAATELGKELVDKFIKPNKENK